MVPEVFNIDGTYIQILLSIRPRIGGGKVEGGANYPSRSDGPNSISFYRRTDHLDIISFLNHIS